ncbi:MAG: hypothetical protein HOQ05_14035 [Corynebacteriales bacterium]|nr:hypothetical protein [Mycobacteriales bacterium]
MARFGRRLGTRARLSRPAKLTLGVAGVSAALLTGGLVTSSGIQAEKASIELAYGAVVSTDPMQGKFRGLGALAPDIDQLRPQGKPFLGTRLNSPFGQPEKSPLETFYEKTAVNYVPNSSDFQPNTQGEVLHDVFEYDRSSTGYQLRRNDIFKAAQTARADLAAIDDNEQWASLLNATSGTATGISLLTLGVLAYRRRGTVLPPPPGIASPGLPAGPGTPQGGAAGNGGYGLPDDIKAGDRGQEGAPGPHLRHVAGVRDLGQGPDGIPGGVTDNGQGHTGVNDPDEVRLFTQAELDAARREGGREALKQFPKEFPNGVVFPGNGAPAVPLSEWQRRQGRNGGSPKQ